MRHTLRGDAGHVLVAPCIAAPGLLVQTSLGPVQGKLSTTQRALWLGVPMPSRRSANCAEGAAPACAMDAPFDARLRTRARRSDRSTGRREGPGLGLRNVEAFGKPSAAGLLT